MFIRTAFLGHEFHHFISFGARARYQHQQRGKDRQGAAQKVISLFYIQVLFLIFQHFIARMPTAGKLSSW